MNSISASTAAVAAAPSVAPTTASSDAGATLLAAANLLLADLERGRVIDAHALRAAMGAAFGGSDSEGAWTWKIAYDACEAAQLLFLRKFGRTMREHAASPSAFLAMLAKVAALTPSHTHRSEESQALQQFSTPIGLGLVASVAAAITPADLVLEPSAGTGLLAIHAELAGATLILNELADTRASLLEHLFPGIAVTRHDAAHIHDHLEAAVRPTVVLMNPPVAAHVDGRVADAALRHIASALARLADGGRLVAITGANLSTDNSSWRESFVRLQERGRIVFSAAIDGRVYARHGTTTETRLTVIDRIPADDPTRFPTSPEMATDPAMLLDWVTALVPARPAVTITATVPATTCKTIAPRRSAGRPASISRNPSPTAVVELAAVEVAYETVDWAPETRSRITDALYEEYRLQSIHIPGSQAHPTRLVQSAAMASVAPPKPSYRPHLPPAMISDGLLSDAQLESVIYAGEAHAGYLAGTWTVDETFDVVATRAEFVEAIEAGGVAAMEVLARDLKLGLYAARSLSFEGIEYELIEHQLTPEQIRIYDPYAAAFQVIHNNLNAALQVANVTGETGTLNNQAKSTARSAFESAKQRFFNHLITAMKTPALIAAVERDLDPLVRVADKAA